MIGDVKHIYTYMLDICMSFLEKNVYSDPLSNLNVIMLCLVFLLLNYMCFNIYLTLTPYQIVMCIYFLPFGRLPFHFVNVFLCCAEAFKFVAVPFVDFSFWCLCFWCQIQVIITKTDVKKPTTYVFFWSYCLTTHIQVCNPFLVNFCV